MAVWVNVVWIYVCELCVGTLCCSCVCVCVFGGGARGGVACVVLCLVLTHPAINCVSTAAVCIGQIESSATGPFCFSPLGWASRPPHSHWSQPSFSYFLYIALRPFLLFFFTPYRTYFISVCFMFLSLSFSFSLMGDDRLVSRTRGRHSSTCCSFFRAGE